MLSTQGEEWDGGREKGTEEMVVDKDVDIDVKDESNDETDFIVSRHAGAVRDNGSVEGVRDKGEGMRAVEEEDDDNGDEDEEDGDNGENDT